MKLVEVHVIQTVAPSNLNRDDTGSPKDALFGGYRRARISSQAQKRAVRVAFRDGLVGQFSPTDLAVRTQRLIRESLVPILKSRGITEDDALIASKKLLEVLKKKDGSFFKKDEPEQTSYLLFVGNVEVEKLADLVQRELAVLLRDALSDKTKKQLFNDLEGILNGGKAVDLALFGRMLADRPELGVDAAAQVAHAISTHKVDREFDFYTAVDDLNPKEETGAGMMGDVEFYSATLYRYAVVNLEKLLENLQGDKDLALKGTLAFLEAFALTLPTGKQNSFAAHNPPLFLAFRAGKGLPRNLATAFERPIRPQEDKPLSALSVEALVKEWEKFDRVFGPLKPEWKGALNLTEGNTGSLKVVESLADLKADVEKALQDLLG
ncbi:type I-E CRISPR-associated protein Cas7/Cse4/CasC [Meiothermus sp. QL-1]|uniref:type I-E CRISPR-associated protein Cas7/Cse4/CasC n=1 Tax=Meiothermus sp. QL-1 TaxID=2058095 RepID=UPI000E0C19C7|nr:type I-E CRISPR-associated protein Cas7/Cse4/CasC [Meiothermus sp. QL-1]RDI95462.1 type I-E CRISPR-associated protein Cas7/Cse4/CasC [Meiothermus sp. QL-1]